MKRYTQATVVLLVLLGLMVAGGLAACRTGGGNQSAAESAPQPPVAKSAEDNQSAEASETVKGGSAVEDSVGAETGAGRTFQIVQDESEARFIIDEVLRGNPKTVVGTTSQVSGELLVDPANPAQAQISSIQVNARDLTTDDNRRNGAIRRFILQSERDENQFIVFEPTAIEGLPEAVTIGQPFEFRVRGDLKIRDVTNSETFEVTVTANSEDELSGLGATTVQRADYGLRIPSVPFVANVSEEIRLEIEFVATTLEAETE